MKEEWKQIKGYPAYQISNYGSIYNSITKRYLKGHRNANGYIECRLYTYDENGKGMKYKQLLVHRLVAENFIPNPNNYEIVNHLDENKGNPRADNLEWTDYKGNANHGTRNEKIGKRGGRKINEYDLDGKYIRTWISAVAVSKYYPIAPRSVFDPCREKKGTVYGRQFRFFDEENYKKDIEAVSEEIRKNVLRNTYDYDIEIDEAYLYIPEELDALTMLQNLIDDFSVPQYIRNDLIEIKNLLIFNALE